MSKKEKAREIARAHGVTLYTSANTDETLAVLDAAAAAVAPGGMRGTITRIGLNQTASGFVSQWRMKGPGGLMQVMTFTASGSADEDESMRVKLEIGEFLYQKGSMFMKPTLNGAKVFDKFRDLVVGELTA